MIRFLMPAALVAVLLTPLVATAQDQRQDAPGEFDFYVLSLSWSPSFCAAAAERGRGRAANAQCGVRPYSFVVHGLWPQWTWSRPHRMSANDPKQKFRDVQVSRGELLGRRTLANEKMVNRVGCHKCGVTLWQM